MLVLEEKIPLSLPVLFSCFCRFVVRIDYWLADSQYPHGHVVQILGPIGDLETEVAALLVENEITASGFTFAQVCGLFLFQQTRDIE